MKQIGILKTKDAVEENLKLAFHLNKLNNITDCGGTHLFGFLWHYLFCKEWKLEGSQVTLFMYLWKSE